MNIQQQADLSAEIVATFADRNLTGGDMLLVLASSLSIVVVESGAVERLDEILQDFNAYARAVATRMQSTRDSK